MRGSTTSGRFSEIIGKIFFRIWITVIIAVLTLGLLGIAVVFVVEFVVPMLPVVGATVGDTIGAVSSSWTRTRAALAAGLAPWFQSIARAQLGYSLALGAAAGALVGLLRYGFSVRSRRVKEIVDMVAAPDMISAIRLGWACLAIHVVAGVASAAVLSWLGLPLTSIVGGGVEALHTQATPAVEWLVEAGFGGGGGGGPEGLLTLLGVLLLVVLLGLVLSAIAIVGISILAWGLASGAAGGVGRSVGLAVALSLTELWRRTIRLSPRPLSRPPPTLDSEIEKFVTTHPFVKNRARAREEIATYLSWLKGCVRKPDLEAVKSFAFDYSDWVKSQGGSQPQDVLYLSVELRESPYVPPPLSATDDAAWFSELQENVFGAGWLSPTLRTGIVAGGLAGALQALIVGILIVFGAGP